MRRKVLHLASSYNLKQRSRKILLYTPCMIPQANLSTKPSVILLSLPIIHATLSHSTHFRATCNFNTDGLVTTDYLRAKTTDFNFLLPTQDPCVKMEYMNIRGYDCYNCTAKFYQKIDEHIHCDSYNVDPCQFTSARNGAVKLHGGEDNFGFYGTINPSHRCTSNDNSTTQWWFGEQ